jgi:tetratricopeptide (TPR) repeat protein
MHAPLVPQPRGLLDLGIFIGTLGLALLLLREQPRGVALDPVVTVQLAADDSLAHARRGDALAEQGDFEGAIAEYTRAIVQDPQCSIAYLQRGILRHREGDLEGAIADYTEAIRHDPRQALAYANRGLCRLRQAMPAQAEADFERSLLLQPSLKAYLEEQRRKRVETAWAIA